VPNQPPVADAGADITVVDVDLDGFEPVTLNGSLSSDPDGSIVSHQWREAGLPLAGGVSPLVTLAVGAHTIDLTVIDEAGATASDVVVVTVEAGTPPPPPPTTDLGTPDSRLESNHVWSGSFDSAMFGASVADAGDVNGDGFSDIVVGAHGWDTVGGLFDEGAAFVFLGGPGGIVGTDPTTANAVLLGDDDGGEFGWSVSGAGDVNGDGFDDIIVGAHHYDSTIAGGTLGVNGAAFVFLGSPTGIVGTGPSTAHAAIFGDQTDCRLGHEVAGAGDVNGDGFGDIIVGAPLRGVPFPPPIAENQGSGDGGAALVFLGSAAGITGTGFGDADRVILHHPPGQPVASGDQVGAGVAAAGDVNNDGFADVLVGADGYIMVFHGSAAGIVGTDPGSAATTIASDATVSIGARIAGAGDVNGDGFDDILAADTGYPTIPFVSTGPGALLVFHGSASGIAAASPAAADAFIEGTAPEVLQSFGWRFSGAGDVDGDGFEDVVVGGLEFDGSLPLEGSAYLFRGSATGLVGSSDADALVRLEAGQSGAAQRANKPGFDVAGAGDVNGDGFADFLMGVGQYDAGQVDEGVVFAYHGRPSAPNPNQPPVAIAGADQILTDVDNNGAETFTLDGSASFDPDGLIVSYAWREGATLLGTSPVLVASFAVQGAGDHVVSLTVTDDSGISRGDTVLVRVNPVPTQFLFQENFTTGFSNWVTGGEVVLTSDAFPGPAQARLGAPGAFMSRSISLPPGATGIAIDFWGKASQFAVSDELLLAVGVDGGPVTIFEAIRPQDEGLDDGTYHFYGGTVNHGPVSASWFPATASNVVLQFESGMTTGFFSIGGLEIRAILAPVTDQVPVASAGADQSVSDADGDGLETVTLDGSASFDPDGSIVSYQWSEGASVLGTTAVLAAPFTVGTHTVTLTVTDDGGASASDALIVTVTPVTNQSPVADAGVDITVVDVDLDGSESVTLDGSLSSDPDDVIVSYQWREAGLPLASGAAPLVTLAVGVHTIDLTVTDDAGATASDLVVVTVEAGAPPANQPPVADAGADIAVVDVDSSGSESVTLNGSGSVDPDGSIVGYEWSEAGIVLGSGVALTANFSPGAHVVQLQVTDDGGATGTDTLVVTVEGAPAPAQGEVAINGSTLTNRGDSVSWTVSLTNTGTTALTGVQLSFAVSPGNRLKNRTPAATVNVADVPVGQSVTQVWSGRANRQGSATVTAEALSGGVSLGTATLQLTVQK